MTIYFAITQKIEVSDRVTDEEIDAIVNEMADGQDCVWSKENNLFYEE